MADKPDAGDIVAQTAGADPAGRHGARRVRQGDGRRRDRARRRAAGARRRHGAAPAAAISRAARTSAAAQPEDGRIDWSKSARRSTTSCAPSRRPIPGAFTDVGGVPARVLRTRVLDAAGAAAGDASPSRGARSRQASRFVAQCGGGGTLRIDALEIDGQRCRRRDAARALRRQPRCSLGVASLACAAAARYNARASPANSSPHETHPHPRRQRLHRPPPVASGSSPPPTGRSTAWTCRPSASPICSAEPRFHFFEGDITINREWIEYHVKKCDVVLPLVAIATPATYVREPLRVFELDFEANLPIVRACVRYRKRVIFPSTSEVYGMCARRGVRSGGLGARARPDQQAALDLLVREAADGPRDPRVRHAGRPRLHAVPAVQLDRRGPRLDQHGRRKAARASSRSSSATSCAASRSSSSTAARRSARSPISTTASPR